MKMFFSGFFSATVILVILFFAMNLKSCSKEVITQAEAAVTAERHQEEISKPKVEVFKKGKELIAKTETQTAHYGNITQEIKIPLSSVQYNHKVGVGVAVINTEVLLSFGYIYKNNEFSLYGGYDGGNNEWKGGLGYKRWFDLK